MDFQCRSTPEGGLDFGKFGRPKVVQFLKEHPGIRMKLTAELPESGKLRRYFEGAIVPLVAFYQEGMDHHDHEDRRRIREWLKLEFNGELIDINGTIHKVGKSTSGREVLEPFVERVIDWLTENYAPPAQALDSKYYKRWKDTIYPHGGPHNYIDYLVELGLLK